MPPTPSPPDLPDPDAITGVLFDFHSTLVDQGDAGSWLRHAWAHVGRPGEAADELGPERADELVAFVDRIWERAREVDPQNNRDLDPTSHRRVFDDLVGAIPAIDADLAGALYEVMFETWIPYQDAIPVLESLQEKGIRTALVSNIGLDIRAVLTGAGLDGLLDAVVLSYEAGVVKPNTAIFTRALDAIGVAPANALMVGDSWRDDGGAADLGIRTLILPRTSGPAHGLDLVLRLVG